MDDIHIVVYTTADLVVVAALAVMVVALAAVLAWAAGNDAGRRTGHAEGREAGARAERIRREARDRRELQDVVDEFGPLRLAVEDRTALRRIK